MVNLNVNSVLNSPISNLLPLAVPALMRGIEVRYGRMEPRRESSDVFKFAKEPEDSIPDPLESNHTNIDRKHDVLADYFHTMICDLSSQFAQK